jgi:transketolase C-terminal domain/subunit
MKEVTARKNEVESQVNEAAAKLESTEAGRAALAVGASTAPSHGRALLSGVALICMFPPTDHAAAKAAVEQLKERTHTLRAEAEAAQSRSETSLPPSIPCPPLSSPLSSLPPSLPQIVRQS